MTKLITWLIYILTKTTKVSHMEWTGKNNYWIAFGKIGE